MMKIIITDKQLKNLRVRRNIIDGLPKYITSTFKWLNPKAFSNFEEFLERVIFSATGDYVGDFIDGPEDYEDLTKMVEPIVRQMVMGQYFDEILDYYHKSS